MRIVSFMYGVVHVVIDVPVELIHVSFHFCRSGVPGELQLFSTLSVIRGGSDERCRSVIFIADD